MLTDKAKEIVTQCETKMQDAINFLEEDLKSYRVGKANPLIFNTVTVDYYGTPTPLPQVASISAPDAKTLALQPWEKSMIGPIEKAIMAANLGLNPDNNGEMIRIMIPPLTEERRRDLAKMAKRTCEDTKIAIRNIRRDAIEDLKKLKKDGLGEDLQKDKEGEIQKLHDVHVKKVDEMYAAKEKDIMTV